MKALETEKSIQRKRMIDLGQLQRINTVQVTCSEAMSPLCLRLLEFLGSLACNFASEGKKEETLSMWKRILSLSRNLFGNENSETLVRMNNYVAALLTLQRYDEGLSIMCEIVDIQKKLFGANDAETLQAMYRCALMMHHLCRFSDAIEMLQKVLRSSRLTHGIASDKTALVQDRLVAILKQLDKRTEAKSAVTVLWSGFLTKQGKIRKSWKRRWFELTDTDLQYFPEPNGDLLGVIRLGDISGVSPSKDFDQPNLFCVRTMDREFFLSADSPGERKDWLSILEQVRKLYQAKYGSETGESSKESGDHDD